MAHILRKTESFTGRFHDREWGQATISALLSMLKEACKRKVSQSPLLSLGLLIVTIFSVETAIMFLFHSVFLGLTPWVENLVDSLSLIIIIIPALSLLFLRPLKLHIAEIKKAGEDLHRSNERFSLAVKGTNDGIWDWDIETNTVYFSPRFMELLNYGPDELAHELATFEFLLHPEDREWVFNRVQQHLEDKVPYNLEYRMRTKNGEYRWFQARGEAVRDQSGKAFRMAGSIADVTEQKTAADVLQQSENKYRLLAENMPDVAWITDRSGRTSYISPNLERVYGYTPEEIYAGGADIWFSRIHADDVEFVAEAFDRLFAEGRDFDIEYRIQRKDGRWIWLHDRSIATGEKNGSKIAYGLFSDITGRKLTELSLKEAKKELEATFDSISDPLFIHDAEFRVVRANNAYLTVSGETKFTDIIGRPYYEVFPKMEGPFKMSRNGMKLQELEEELKLPPAGKTFRVKSYPVKDADGNYLYSVLIFEDMTEAARAQERIKEEIEVTTHLNMIAEATAHTTSIDRLMEQALYCTGKIAGCDIALFYLWDSAEKVFKPSHGLGLPNNQAVFFRTEPVHEEDLEDVLLKGQGDGFTSGAANFLDAKDVLLGIKPVIIQLGVRSEEFGDKTPVSQLFPWLTEGNIKAMAIIMLNGRKEALGFIAGIFLRPVDITEKLQRVMQGISNQVSVALEEAKLYRESVERAIELSNKIETIKVMHEIDSSILSTLDPRELLGTVTRLVGRLIPSDRVTVVTVDKERRIFNWGAGFGTHFIEGIKSASFEDTSAGEIVETGRLEYIANLRDIKNPLPIEKGLLKEGFLSHIRVPLKSKGVVIGILTVGAKRQSAYSPQDLSTLEKLAYQTGVALSNTRLISDLEHLFLGTIRTLSSAIDAKSQWTAGHSERVTKYALHIGNEIGLSEKELKDLELAGLLHDVGKIGTNEAILDKPGKLTDEEYELIKKHPVKGTEMLEHIKQLKDIIPGVRHHHEFYNGKGYPDGLTGEDISLMARILTVADTYDAMKADRPYRSGRTAEFILKEFKRCSGTQFDPKVVDAFLRVSELAVNCKQAADISLIVRE